MEEKDLNRRLKSCSGIERHEPFVSKAELFILCERDNEASASVPLNDEEALSETL